MIDKDRIKKRLSNALKDIDIDKNDILKKLKISKHTYEQYISGKKFPSFMTFAKMYELLDLNLNDILCVPKKKTDKKSNDTK